MSTTTQEIPRQAWRVYFDELTKVLGTVEATVELVGRDVGAQFPAERQVLTGMEYDDAADRLTIRLDKPGPPVENIEHVIEHPERVYTAAGQPPPLELLFDIQDAQGHQWIIRLERPPALPGE
jgi:hypothetical protein